MSLLAEHLRARRVVRPSVWVLARLIGRARDAAHETVLQRLAEQLRPARCADLDRLLEVDPARKVSEIVWLRTPIGRVGIKGALEQVAKYQRLDELHAADVDLSSLPPSRRRHLAAQAAPRCPAVSRARQQARRGRPAAPPDPARRARRASHRARRRAARRVLPPPLGRAATREHHGRSPPAEHRPDP